MRTKLRLYGGFMYHWESAPRVGQWRTEPWLFRVCEDAIPDDYRVSGKNPQIQLVLSPTLIVHRQLRWDSSIALLAAGSMLAAAKTRALGFRAETQTWDRWGFTQYAVGLWAKTYFMVEALDAYGDGPAFMFRTRDEADALASYFATDT